MKEAIQHDAFYSLLEGREKQLGATSLEEQIYVEWLSSQVDLSKGVIVDLGCWLGSFSNAAARGARTNPTTKSGDKVVFAFDRFRWNSCFEGWVAGTSLVGRFQENEDFISAYHELTSSNRDLIEAESVDLENASWPERPIAILINDVWKNFELAISTAQAFFPHLLDGAYVVHQDYLWCTDVLVQILMYRLRNFFEPIYQVPNANTVVFRCSGKITLADLQCLPGGLDEIPFSEVDQAIDWSQSFLNLTGRGAVELGRVWMYLQKGDRDGAVRLARKLLGQQEGDDPFVKWQMDILTSWEYGFLFAD